MALEDALILETLLGKARLPKDLQNAFAAYDDVRRPRTQHVIRASRGTGRLFCGCDEDAGLEPKKLREVMPQRWRWIWDLDVKQHVFDALESYNKLRADTYGEDD